MHSPVPTEQTRASSTDEQQTAASEDLPSGDERGSGAGAGNSHRLASELLLAAGVIALGVLLILLLRTLLLVLAGVLLALLMHAVSRALSRLTHVRYGVALAATVLLGLGLLILGVRLGGPELVSQIDALSNQLSTSVDEALETVRSSKLGQELLRRAQPAQIKLPSQSTLLSGATSVLGGGIELIVVVVLGLFLAAAPNAYIDSFRYLVPRHRRPRADALLEALAHALRWWLVGRLSSMFVVGVLTTVGLLALSVPLAIPLGILAAVLCFIPYIGPLLSAVPAIVIGLAESPTRALIVAALYAGVQFAESYLITPLIQLRAVSIPPAALLLAQLVMGLFAGSLGVLMATPAAVLVIVSVQILYVRDVLGEPIQPLGHR